VVRRLIIITKRKPKTSAQINASVTDLEHALLLVGVKEILVIEL
jgi:hypothetical protein